MTATCDGCGSTIPAAATADVRRTPAHGDRSPLRMPWFRLLCRGCTDAGENTALSDFAGQ